MEPLRGKIFLASLFLSLASSPFPASNAADSPATLSWQKIDEGFETRSMQVNGSPYQTFIKLRVLRVDLEQFQVRVLDSRAFATDRLPIKVLAKKTQALAAINVGFFLPDYRPLGLLIVDGQEVNPLRNADWGVFLIQGNRPRMIHTKEFQNDRTISQALQVGPRLVAIPGRSRGRKRNWRSNGR